MAAYRADRGRPGRPSAFGWAGETPAVPSGSRRNSWQPRIEAKGEQQPGHVGVVFGRRRGAAGDPVEEIGIRAFEESLVAAELRIVESGEIRLGERAEDQIGFARAAVPRAEEEPLAADVAIGDWHDCTDIDMLAARVSRHSQLYPSRSALSRSVERGAVSSGGALKKRIPGESRDPLSRRWSRGKVGPGFPHGTSPWAEGPRE